MLDKTMTFSVGVDREGDIKKILTIVYDALKEKGYNPINQMVGYILSEDPTYITTHNNARSLIRKIDRDELLQFSSSLTWRTDFSAKRTTTMEHENHAEPDAGRRLAGNRGGAPRRTIKGRLTGLSTAKKEASFPTYKGKPLVRCGDVIYYGSMKDKYVVKLEIKSKKKVQDWKWPIASRSSSCIPTPAFAHASRL